MKLGERVSSLKNISMSRWLWIFLAIALLRGALYTFVVPPWQHPDEPTHFEHMLDIATAGGIVPENYVSLPLRRGISSSMLAHNFWKGITQPGLDDQSLSAVGWSPLGIYALTQPKLYYVIGALWVRPWLGFPVDFQLYIVRLLSVFLNLVVVAVTFYTARRLFSDKDYIVLAVIGFVVFLPGYTDDMSAVNNDVLANVLAALFFGLVALVYRNRWNWRALILLGLLLALAILTKTTALILVMTLPALFLFYPAWSFKRKWAVLLSVVVLVGLATWYVFQFNQPLFQSLVAKLGQYLRVNMSDSWQAMLNLGNLRLYYATALTVFKSFWAAFGWRHVTISSVFYWTLGAITLIAAGGLVVWTTFQLVRKNWTGLTHWRISYLIASASAVILAWLVAIVRGQMVQGHGIYLSHGRYAYVALLPFALLFVLGLGQWLPARWHKKASVALVILMAVFDAVCFWGYLVHYYYLKA